jgi:multiple sugar transport system permease protein
VSVVVLSLVFKGLYATDGAINGLLGALGLPQPAWLNDPRTALPAIMAMDVWAASGYYMIILLAGLEGIPRELYDAARIEGASAWARFTRITLPLLRPTLLFVLVVNTVRSLQIFAEVFVMTRGGPLRSTNTVVYYLYEQAFYRFDLGYASAVAYLLFLLTLGLAFVQMRTLRGAPEAAR